VEDRSQRRQVMRPARPRSRARGLAVAPEATAIAGRLEVRVTHIPAGNVRHAAASLASDEVMIVLEGVLEVMVGGSARRVGPGEVIFPQFQQACALRNVGDTPAVCHVVRRRS
jgi:mannose-6-phosphate isomerase-like protein (cupin superfamily)